MYRFKNNFEAQRHIDINSTSQTVGMSPIQLFAIITGIDCCNKLTAYCITKCLDQESEIDDYFTIV